MSTTSANGQTGETNTEQIPKAILTLALSPRDAQRLVYAQGHGELYFGLLGKDSKPDTTTKIDAENLFR